MKNRNPILFLAFIAGLVGLVSWLFQNPSNVAPEPLAPQLPLRSATTTIETTADLASDESATSTEEVAEELLPDLI